LAPSARVAPALRGEARVRRLVSALEDHLEIVLPRYPPLHQHPCDKLDVVLVMVQEQAGCVVVLGNGGTRVPLSYLLGFYRCSRSPAVVQTLPY